MGFRIVRTTKQYLFHPVDLSSRPGRRLRRLSHWLDRRKTNRWMAKFEKHIAKLSPHDRAKLAIELVKRRGVQDSMSQNQTDDLVQFFRQPWETRRKV